MKRFALFVSLLFIGGAVADSTPTSVGYVDNAIGALQNKISAVDTNTVLTTTNTAGEIGQKSIYDSAGNYAEQQNALVPAEIANAAIQNAIDTEFVCTEWLTNSDQIPENCLLWTINTRNLLPANYTQLEYIRFDGASYIDTGVVLTDEKYIENTIEAQLIQYNGYGFNTITGFMPRSPDLVSPRYGIHAYTGAWMVGINNTKLGTAIDHNMHRFHFITNDTQSILYDTDNTTVLVPWGYMASISGNKLSLYIGARHENAGAVNYFNGNIGYAYLRQNGTTLYELIPCKRNSDGAPGFYDTVSGNFLTGGGTGTLTAGPLANFLPQNQ